jgi:hypothetical protein
VSTEGIRTVEVLPPSASGETRLVLRASAAIVFGALFVIGLHAGSAGPGGGPRAGDLAPFQILFRDAPAAVQLMFRELQEGVREAENTRAADKRWPAVETLAAQGIPPFASDAVVQPAYRWHLVQDGVYVNYRGVPAPGASAPVFLVLIQEPEPGAVDALAVSTPPDEVHHRLADGTPLLVSIWFRAGGAPAPDGVVITRPFAEGWTQVLAGSQGP